MFTENKFTKHSMIKNLLVFLFVALFALVICFNGMVCHAEELEQVESDETSISDIYDYDFEEFPFWTIQGYQNSVIYDSSVQTFNNWVSPATQSLINSLDVSDYSDYPYFCVLQGDTNTNLFVFVFYKDGSLIISGNSKSGLFGSSDYAYVVSYNTTGGVLTFNSNETEFGSGDYIISPRNNLRLVCSNNDVYGTVGVWNDVNTLPSATSKNFNYVIYDENGNLIYNNPILNGGGSGTSSEDIEKGLYLLKGSCVYLDNKSFNDGNLYVNALLTDSQKSNPNLQLAVKGSCTYSFAQTALSETRRHVYVDGYSSSGTKDIFNVLWPDADNGLTSHEKTVTCRFGLLGYQPYSTSYISDNKGTNLSTLSQVNSTMFTSDIGSSGFSFGGANIQGIASAYDSVNSGHFNVNNVLLKAGDNISVSVGYLDGSTQNTNVYLTDVRYHFELYMIDTTDSNNIEWSDLIYSYDCDLLRGTSSVGTDGTLTYDDLDNNFDGDIPSEYLPSTDVNSSGGSASSSSGGNNQVVTINGDDSAKYLPSLINKLVPSTEGDGGLSDDFQNLTNSNGWIQYMSATLYFVPASVWTTLNTYFITFIGIIGVAFIIRIILDLL